MQRVLFCLMISLWSLPLAQASTVEASSFGYDPTNATAAFQAAIQSDFDTIIIDLQAEDWWLEPNRFFNIEDKYIFFERGVVLRALPGAFNDQNANLVRFVGGKNIVLKGYGAAFQMNKEEYDTIEWSEWRHCLALWDCENISIEGLTFRDSGGDGIFIGGSHEFSIGYSKDITIKNVVCDNNYRQGISVISVENLLVQHSRFENTAGTLPEAGVDIEPDVPEDRLVNIKFKDCSFQNNGWAGIALALHNLDGSSEPVSIEFKDCYLKENRRPENTYAWCEIFVDSKFEDPVQGDVLFERVFVDGSEWGAFYSRKTAESFEVTFRDCVFKDVSQSTIEFNEPITLEVPSYEVASPALGGYQFDNLVISYPTDIDFFRVFGAPTLEGVADIAGQIRVVSPNAPGIDYANQTLTNVTFDYIGSSTLPSTLAEIQAFIDPLLLAECDQIGELLLVDRLANQYDFPLAINYEVGGEAINGDDYDYIPPGRIIPTEFTQLQVPIIPRFDLEEESEESFTTQLSPSTFYNSEDTPTTLYLTDCLITNTAEASAPNRSILAFPNPTASLLQMAGLPANCRIHLYNNFGQLVKTIEAPRDVIDLSLFPNGVYFINIQDEAGQLLGAQKIIKQ